MQEFIIHIHLYLTEKESELTAYQNLKRLKRHGFTILITSPKPLPNYFYEFIDYFYYDTENQLLTREYEGIEPTVWWITAGNTQLNFIVNNIQRHGLAVLRSMIKGCQVANLNGYKYIIRFEYDDFFGVDSIKQIKKTAKEIAENDYDFYLYKNDYPGRRSDVSVHLMYYKCSKFLEIFQGVKDEETYNDYLTTLGESKQALILEQLILLALKKTNISVDVNFQSGETLETLYRDTDFNMHQTSTGLKDGILSDVLVLKVNKVLVDNQVYLAAQNVFSEEAQRVYFDIFDYNDKLIHTYLLELEKGYWKISTISLEGVGTIKIKHNNSEYHKSISIDPTTRRLTVSENGIKLSTVPEAIITE